MSDDADKLRYCKEWYNDDLDNCTIPDSDEYYESMIYDVPEDLVKRNIMYMFRVYIRYEDKYVYKVGFTNNLLERIKQLDSEFGCLGRIIPVLLCKVECMLEEKDCKLAIDTHKVDVTIKQVKKGECYKICPEVYDTVKEKMDELKESGEVYESEDYVLEDDNKEYYLDEELTQDDNEAAFWRQQIHGATADDDDEVEEIVYDEDSEDDV
jgi:hypothetical protein